MEMALRTSNLLLPEGFVEMDREEMMYVDGGGIPTWVAYYSIEIIIWAVGLGFTIGGSIAARKALMENGGKYLAKKTIPQILKKVGVKTSLEIALGAFIDFVLIFFDPVQALVDWFDGLDGKKDGWLGKKGWLNW